MDEQIEDYFTETQQKIMDATIELVGENGYKATTTRGIATRASVNESTVFKNFANKRIIFISAFHQQLQDLIQVIASPTIDEEQPVDAYMKEIAERMFEAFVKRSSLITITLREIGNADLKLDKNTVLEQLVNHVVMQLQVKTKISVERLTTPVFMFVTSLMFKVIDDSHEYRLTDDLQADISLSTIVENTIKMIV